MEARRKAEVEQARAAGLPLPVYCRPAGKFRELTINLEDIDPDADPGGPELPTPRGVSVRPPPGAYVRGAHTVAMATELALAAGLAGRRDKKSAESFNKKIDLAMEELGVRPPHTASRAVCRAWYALRKEVMALLEVRMSGMLHVRACVAPAMLTHVPPMSQLRTQLARKNKELTAAAGAASFGAGAAAATPYGMPSAPLDGLGSPLKARCVRAQV